MADIEPLKPHVLDNLEGRARTDLEGGHPSASTRLPAHMLLSLIVEVRKFRAARADADLPAGRAPLMNYRKITYCLPEAADQPADAHLCRTEGHLWLDSTSDDTTCPRCAMRRVRQRS